MFKKITAFLLWASCATFALGQYVTINDASFVSWLQQNYPTCMSGNQMDTTCTAITTTQVIQMTNKNINNLWGIQFFDMLRELHCGMNNLSFFPPVGISVKKVIAFDNDILFSPPSFHLGLEELDLSRNPLTSLAPLPVTLRSLMIDSVRLSPFPTLPPNLAQLGVSRTNMSQLPPLPANLISLSCYTNPLSTLPPLPTSLLFLNAAGCNLTALPQLPPNMWQLDVAFNSLSQLPLLPSTLRVLDARSNQIQCLPELPLNMSQVKVSNNQLTCVPNYLSVMSASLLALPLCKPNDMVNNPNGCVSVEGISGYTFEDSNQDCIFNSSDVGLKNIPLKVFASGNQIGSVITARNGVYQFPIGAGNYRVELDVATAPIAFSCPNPGLDSNVVVATAAPFVENVNFEVTCPSGFDVGAQAAFPVGPVFPGQSHVLHVSAGDRSNFYGLHCAAGTVGQVVIEVTGPVTYTGPGAGALSPSISGITYTYGPVDFDTINFSTDFALGFFTDTTAQSGDTICVNVTVTPTLGDNDASNNSLALCYQVSNSLDPNDKIVYPTQVTTGYTGWLYYTLRFQNTGTAPAYNIRLADTLANELDWSTFQLLEMSHTATVSLVQGNLNFKFDGILLPDSLSDPLGSQGFVQFRMRPKSTVPDGWEVKNTASIYFDFNPPVVTNTAKTLFGDMVAVADPFIQGWLKVFPNPGKGQFQVTWEGPKSAGPITLTVYNAMGQLVSTKQSFREVASFDLQQQAAGIYFVRASSKAGNQVVRLIKR